MLHDFAVSQRHLVFLLAPITMDMAAVRAGASMINAMRWAGEQPTRVLVVDKADFAKQRIFEMPAAHVFHFGNAWDDGRTLRLDYVQSTPLPEFNVAAGQIMRGERTSRDVSTPRVLEIDLQTGRLQRRGARRGGRVPRRRPACRHAAAPLRLVSDGHRYRRTLGLQWPDAAGHRKRRA